MVSPVVAEHEVHPRPVPGEQFKTVVCCSHIGRSAQVMPPIVGMPLDGYPGGLDRVDISAGARRAAQPRGIGPESRISGGARQPGPVLRCLKAGVGDEVFHQSLICCDLHIAVPADHAVLPHGPGMDGPGVDPGIVPGPAPATGWVVICCAAHAKTTGSLGRTSGVVGSAWAVGDVLCNTQRGRYTHRCGQAGRLGRPGHIIARMLIRRPQAIDPVTLDPLIALVPSPAAAGGHRQNLIAHAVLGKLIVCIRHGGDPLENKAAAPGPPGGSILGAARGPLPPLAHKNDQLIPSGQIHHES